MLSLLAQAIFAVTRVSSGTLQYYAICFFAMSFFCLSFDYMVLQGLRNIQSLDLFDCNV